MYMCILLLTCTCTGVYVWCGHMHVHVLVIHMCVDITRRYMHRNVVIIMMYCYRPLLEGENDFSRCLSEMFPELKV